MKKKMLIVVVIAVFFLFAAAIIRGHRKENDQSGGVQDQQTETAQETGAAPYIEAEPYRDTEAEEKILPCSIEVSDENGNIYMIEEFDDNARRMIVGKYGEIGRYPSVVYFVGNDKIKIPLERHSYEYNRDGFIVKEYCYSDPDPYDDYEEQEIVSKTEFTYYRGRLSREVDYILGSAGRRNAVTTFEYSYDDNGFLEKIDVYDGPDIWYSEEITCNTNGSPVISRQYTYDGVLMGVKEYSYSETGDIQSYKEYTGEKDFLNSESIYMYDSRDYLRKVTTKNFDYQGDPENPENTTPQENFEIYNVIYSSDNIPKLGEFRENGNKSEN